MSDKINLELTDSEKEIFRVSWLASKDITKPEFYDSFKPFWVRVSSDIEALCKQAGYPIKLHGTRIAVTTQTDRTFAYSPKANGYMLNIWDFIFRNDREKIYLKPLEFVASGFVHEENHRNFFQKNGMIGRPSEETENFRKEYYFEYEKMAILDEIGFLNNVRKQLPQITQERAYIINSWSDLGLPDCKITDIGVCPPIRVDFELSARKNVFEQLVFLQNNKTSVEQCQVKNNSSTSDYNLDLLIALKLSSSCAFIEIPRL